MKIDRRLFLIGTAALMATPAISKPSQFMEKFSTGLLKGNRPRAIADVTFSCMPTGEEIRAAGWREDPVIFRFSRGDQTMLQVQLNPRATYRWVACPGAEILLPKDQFLRVEVEPCYASFSMSMVSDLQLNPHRPREYIADSFLWKDGKLINQESNYLNLLNIDAEETDE